MRPRPRPAAVFGALLYAVRAPKTGSRAGRGLGRGRGRCAHSTRGTAPPRSGRVYRTDTGHSAGSVDACCVGMNDAGGDRRASASADPRPTSPVATREPSCRPLDAIPDAHTDTGRCAPPARAQQHREGSTCVGVHPRCRASAVVSRDRSHSSSSRTDGPLPTNGAPTDAHALDGARLLLYEGRDRERARTWGSDTGHAAHIRRAARRADAGRGGGAGRVLGGGARTRTRGRAIHAAHDDQGSDSSSAAGRGDADDGARRRGAESDAGRRTTHGCGGWGEAAGQGAEHDTCDERHGARTTGGARDRGEEMEATALRTDWRTRTLRTKTGGSDATTACAWTMGRGRRGEEAVDAGDERGPRGEETTVLATWRARRGAKHDGARRRCTRTTGGGGGGGGGARGTSTGRREKVSARAATTRIGHDGPRSPSRTRRLDAVAPTLHCPRVPCKEAEERTSTGRRVRGLLLVLLDSDVPRIGLGLSGSPAACASTPRYPSSHTCLHDASTARDAPTLHPIPASLRLCAPSHSFVRIRRPHPRRTRIRDRVGARKYGEGRNAGIEERERDRQERGRVVRMPANTTSPTSGTKQTSTSAIDPRPRYSPARDEGATASTNRVEPSPGKGEGLRRDSYEQADGGGAVEERAVERDQRRGTSCCQARKCDCDCIGRGGEIRGGGVRTEWCCAASLERDWRAGGERGSPRSADEEWKDMEGGGGPVRRAHDDVLLVSRLCRDSGGGRVRFSLLLVF
ncbi:hypothetical protein B0H17DRAFT_296889 [Mycena rosella]|uniref:Uncharacterized protein n=1 Tax=Mycena rosella TaxID=1033263 RepID=A0AAD7GQB1_MYCRO|nr:hypothetical protein B0H17DRAFT_296889 [Mycena rosella]